MSYSVILPNSIQRKIERIPAPASTRLLQHILQLEQDPRARGSRKLRGSNGWRIRVGDYRVIYDIDDVSRTVVIRRVGHRKEIYREL